MSGATRKGELTSQLPTNEFGADHCIRESPSEEEENAEKEETPTPKPTSPRDELKRKAR